MYYQTLYASFLFLLIAINACSQQSREQSNSTSDNGTDTNHDRKEVVVFVYHRFGDNKYPSTNISSELFEQHLSHLKINNFLLLSFGDAVDYLNDSSIPYQEKVACITIDDGYKSFGENGLPLLKKYGFPATLFINSESVGGGTYLSWDELKKIHEQGIEIGNHSHSHAFFVNVPDKERKSFFKEDVKICQEAIRKNLGFVPDVFAYPYGEYDKGMKEALKELGFKAAAAQNSGVMYQSDMFALPRFPMAGPFTALDGFKEKAAMKALRVKPKEPDSNFLLSNNPPTLTLNIMTEEADLSRANCFISGGCEKIVGNSTVQIKAQKSLGSRRTLYTVTAPSKSSKGWYWYSHLWIRPEIPE